MGRDFLVRFENRGEQRLAASRFHGDEIGPERDALIAGAVADEATALINRATAGGVAGEGEGGLERGGDLGARRRDHRGEGGAGEGGDFLGFVVGESLDLGGRNFGGLNGAGGDRREQGDGAVLAGDQGGEHGLAGGGRAIAPGFDQGRGHGGQRMLGEDLDRGGLNLGRLAGGEAGDEGAARGVVGRDVEQGEGGEAGGDGSVGVGGGGGGAGEDRAQFAGGIGGGDRGAVSAEAVAEGAEPERIRAGRGDESDQFGPVGGGAERGANFDQLGDKRGGRVGRGEIAGEGGEQGGVERRGRGGEEGGGDPRLGVVAGGEARESGGEGGRRGQREGELEAHAGVGVGDEGGEFLDERGSRYGRNGRAGSE